MIKLLAMFGLLSFFGSSPSNPCGGKRKPPSRRTFLGLPD